MARTQENQNYITRVTNAESVTATDDVVQRYDALYVGTGGNLALIPRDGTSAVTFTNISNGSFLPIATKEIRSTSTTCSGIVGLIIDG